MSRFIQTQLGTRIKALRKARGFDQAAFAQHIDMDRSYLASIESGTRNVTLRNLVKIAKGLDVSLSELFERIDVA